MASDVQDHLKTPEARGLSRRDSEERRRRSDRCRARQDRAGELARRAGVSREATYKGLVPGGNLTLGAPTRITKAMGLRLTVVAERAEEASQHSPRSINQRRICSSVGAAIVGKLGCFAPKRFAKKARCVSSTPMQNQWAWRAIRLFTLAASESGFILISCSESNGEWAATNRLFGPIGKIKCESPRFNQFVIIIGWSPASSVRDDLSNITLQSKELKNCPTRSLFVTFWTNSIHIGPTICGVRFNQTSSKPEPIS